MNQPSLAQLEQAARQGNEFARLELASQLIANPPGSTECQRGLELLRTSAQGSQGPAAQWLLGGFYLQNLSLPDAPGEALQWMEKAAAAGVPPAIDRLANMYLRGVGVEYAPTKALELLQSLADIGFQRSVWDVGYLFSQEASAQGNRQAASAFARACALGYPPAYYSLGLRFARGSGVARDPAFARALLMRAADARFPDALELAEEYAPVSEWGERSAGWYQKLKQQYAEAESMQEQLMQADGMSEPALKALINRLESHFAAIGHPQLFMDNNGRLTASGEGEVSIVADPGPWEWLSEQPRVAVSHNFITREERAHVLFNVSGALSNPETYTTNTSNGEAENRFFNGQGYSMGAMTTDTVVRVIERRVARMTDWRMDALEPSSVIAYQPGNEYQPHVDYFSEGQIARNRTELRDFSGQRVITFLICLQAAAEGGGTEYPRTGVKVSYQAGQAMQHYNVTEDGKPDPLSMHIGAPVKQGEKWLLRTTLREKSRYFA